MVGLEAPPVLSTPESHVFEDPTLPLTLPRPARLSEEQLFVTYEIERTVTVVRQERWRRIALQFPDDMLVDAPRVFEALSRGLKGITKTARGTLGGGHSHEEDAEVLQSGLEKLEVSEDVAEDRLYILADTSYGACCVDELAAEHVDADVIVHYGRACLSPTARLPVIHVFTNQPLPLKPILQAFKETYSDRDEKIILMADVIYSNHVPQIYKALRDLGYNNIYPTFVVHDPSSPLPNRTVPAEVADGSKALGDYQLFHISEPPGSLLLTLSSRVSTIHIYPTTCDSSPTTLPASTTLALRRRYALLTSLSTVPIFGILINTLSIKNYLHVVEHVKAQIAAAGKKSYTFVVGKVNAAKVANFSEVGGWIVIGCWESSLFESKDFWKPIVTPFELGLALRGDKERIWTGEWRADWQEMLDGKTRALDEVEHTDVDEAAADNEDLGSESESAPPEFDLRTGRYVSHTRPVQIAPAKTVRSDAATALIKRAKGGLATVGGRVSSAAEFLKSQRTWNGLGSDFEIAYEEGGRSGAPVEQGRSGIARGYTVGAEGVRT
ncbi:MAG: Diphthamide biosynthesis protein 2 [Candelina submexicana]|nr:MAG: Diphthamide biosynthesis protein 2 [Candelina submexicana]